MSTFSIKTTMTTSIIIIISRKGVRKRKGNDSRISISNYLTYIRVRVKVRVKLTLTHTYITSIYISELSDNVKMN